MMKKDRILFNKYIFAKVHFFLYFCKYHINKPIKMDIEQVRDYALSLHGTTEDMPYGPDCVVFRIEGKIFLHISLESSEPRCAVKLDPALGVELRERENGICPAYHMNKVHWNDLYLEQLNDDMVMELIDHSYRLVLQKLPKRLREKYEING
jgi:cytoplasmic protein